eukprot:sb/3471977/
MFDLETYPIEILSTNPANSMLNLVMFTADETDKWAWDRTDPVLGYIRITLEPTTTSYNYYIYGKPGQLEKLFPVQPPNNNTKIWRITRTVDGFKISCNGVDLLTYIHHDSHADQWNNYKAEKIMFWLKGEGDEWSDTVSEKFRAGGVVYLFGFIVHTNGVLSIINNGRTAETSK